VDIRKIGADVTIGYHFIARSWIQSRILLRNPKPSLYAQAWDAYALNTVVDTQLSQSVLGQMNYAATVDLRIKGCSSSTNRAMHVNSRLSNSNMHPLPRRAADDICKAANLMRQDVGINLFCDTIIPLHSDLSTISQRSDACLNEPDNYNGFGVWWLIPQPNGKPKIIAAFDKWTENEEVSFGKNIAAAEAVGVVLGGRLLDDSISILPSHTSLLQLSDSETTFVKFNNVRLGSKVLELLRSVWQEAANNRDLATHLGYIPREWNVGSDLLSKGHWALFCNVMKLAGLDTPIRLAWPDHTRSTKDLL